MTSLNEWIDIKIKDDDINYFEYGEFSNLEKAGDGSVNRADWNSGGIKVALKILANNPSVNEDNMNQFLKELRKVSFHPNINQFLGITKETSSNSYVMVLQYANQGNLREYLKNNFDSLQWKNKIQMALDITCGLKCLHSRNVIHRDLHARNILVHDNKLMIADLGLSKQLTVEVTSNSTVYGMPAYIEPQCYRKEKYVRDKKSDIYSLGVLFWEITSGCPPLISNVSYYDLIRNISEGFREQPIDGTPSDYVNLYQKCWDVDPSLRPTIDDVFDILETISLQSKAINKSDFEITEDLSMLDINETNPANLIDQNNSHIADNIYELNSSQVENQTSTPLSSISLSIPSNNEQAAINLNSVHNQSNKSPDYDNNDDIQKQNIESIKSINESENNYELSNSSCNSPIPTTTPQKQKRPSGLRIVTSRRGVDESWVNRLTAEDLFEHLDPCHDLDKPIIDASGSSVQQLSNNEESQSMPIVSEKTGRKIQRGKFIRAAAREAYERKKHERKESTEKLVGVVNTIKEGQKLIRKPTTKLWDKKVVEVVSSHKKPCPSVVSPEESVSAERKAIRWVKGELIGKGTFGKKVFLAMNMNSSEIIAVKQIELPTTKSDLLNERYQYLVNSFINEMEILKDLDHNHIVQYIGFERNNEAINIFLEYVNGGSISTCLRIYGRFKEPVVMSFTQQILLGLQYLHNKGILHGAIKANNILIDEEGCCKISDFGMSKKSDHADYNSNMSSQDIFWMAPEVFSKGHSAKVDIWSLGCVVLEMFSGERPWPNLTDLAVMFKLGSEKKAPPIREDIVMSLKAEEFLKDQCFIIEPDHRPTAEQLLQHPFAQEDPYFHFKEYISMPRYINT